MVEKKKIKYRAIVPNIFTIGNMFCGFTSIVYSFKGEFTTAFWLIVVGGLFDALDGKIARFLDTSSDFGVEYDSLSDFYLCYLVVSGWPGLMSSWKVLQKRNSVDYQYQLRLSLLLPGLYFGYKIFLPI